MNADNQAPDPKLAMRQALRKVLKHHGVTVHGDAVLESDLLSAVLNAGSGESVVVGSIHRSHLQAPSSNPDEHWCKEVFLYSPANPGDTPANRVMLYTGGPTGDCLEWAEKGLAEWRSAAMTAARHREVVAATARTAIKHLQDVLNKARTHAEQQAADTAARDWLVSIGSEPS